MSAHLCPRCREIGFTWSIDENESNLTRWHCSVCRYSALEDETEQGACPTCGAQSAMHLRDESQSYRYCTACHSRWLTPSTT